MKKIFLLCSVSFLCGTLDAQWTVQTSGTLEHLYGLFFTTSDAGVAVGAHGTMLKTTDGGQNWQNLTPVTAQKLNDVFFAGTAIAYAVGDFGTILKSTDSGSSWSALTSGTSNNLYSVSFISATTGWVSGVNNTILYTNDGGLNWSSISATVATSFGWNTIHAFSNSSIMVGGNFQSYALTINNGSSWLENRLGSVVGKGCCAITGQSFPTATEGYMVANSGDLLHTTDAGNVWTLIDSTSLTGSDADDIFFPSLSHGWVVGSGPIIHHTSNAALSWSSQANPSSNSLHDVFFLDNNTGYIIGSTGTIMKTTNGGTVGVSEINSTEFSVNVFPNPAQNDFKVEINSGKATPANLLITDLNGNKLISLERSDASNFHSFSLKKEQLASGVYFLTVQTETANSLQKLVIE